LQNLIFGTHTRRDMLAATPLRIKEGAHRLSEGSCFNGPLAVVHIPRFEQLYDLTAVRKCSFLIRE
jgi:hypothetical protein